MKRYFILHPQFSRKFSRIILGILSLLLAVFWSNSLIVAETTKADSWPEDLFSYPLPSLLADSPAAMVDERLQKVKILRGDFLQIKKISALRRPLQSQGSFIFAKNQGLFWDMKTPYQTQTLITLKKIVQRTANGDFETITAEDQPVTHEFTKVFLKLFAGDYQSLRQYFDVYFVGTTEKWSIGLIPKDSAVASFISKMILQGQQFIETIEIIEARSDKTYITFSNLTDQPSIIKSEEAQYFNY